MPLEILRQIKALLQPDVRMCTEALKLLAQAITEAEKVCEWKLVRKADGPEMDRFAAWVPKCMNSLWESDTNELTKFCPYCGHRVKEIKQ